MSTGIGRKALARDDLNHAPWWCFASFIVHNADIALYAMRIDLEQTVCL
jgi:hypothetical protein